MPLRRLLALVICAACLCGVAAGCGKDGHRSNGSKSESYRDDGYLGMSNSNPGIPGPNMTDNYGADADFMRKTISKVPGVEGSRIVFHGADVYVTLKLRQGSDARDPAAVQSQAESALRFNFPRYHVHVRSVED
ncbi:hypothetical protein SD71_19185 [Cohnella kolymensis]|uniref:Sporulation protein n=1 Tax=Cohnella kolymensis TaxID=1590652 RepID=A0ABR5A1Q9_9BACL|nr:hypothetical protein [Cohnella kolymensis]KIL34578.1 hypothetical protein SD71_19185 [Cohnella kolymensis]